MRATPGPIAMAALAGLAAMVLGPRNAAAEEPARTLEDGDHYFRLEVPAGWQATTPPTGGEEILLSYRQPDREWRLALTRVGYPNRRAWRREPKFFDEVVAGFDRSGLHLERRRVFQLGRVPAMDLELSDGQHLIAVRFLFFRTFSLALAIRADAGRRSTRAIRNTLDSFQPYFEQ